MKKLYLFQIIVLAIAVMVSCTRPSAVLVPGSPSSVNVSEAGLDSIDKMLQQAVDSGWIAGAVGLMARDGKIVYNKAFGYSNIAEKTPMVSDNIFRIASQTKAIASIGLMTLYDKGKFKLDDPVSKYIPEFANPQVIATFNPADTTYTSIPATREIKIKDLLTHTSGIDYAGIGSPNMVAIYAKAGIPVGFESGRKYLADGIKKLGKLPLVHNPGEKFTYGLNTDVVGYLVEVLSGETLDQYLRKNVFEPLGMNDTYFYLPGEKVSRLADVHSPSGDGSLTVVKNPMTNYPVDGETYFSGGAGLSSTTHDYAAFLQMILNKGEYNGNVVLTPSTVDLILSNHIGDLTLGRDKFGLGFQITTKAGSADSGMSEGSFSWGGYYSTSYWGDPVKNVVGLLFIQQFPMEHGEVHTNFRRMVYSSLEE